MTRKKILYITYDGISDPLGQSQILPYLKGLSEYGYQFTILSFEKKERFGKQEKQLRDLMKQSGIDWVPLTFSTRPPLLAKFYDAMRMRRKAIGLQRKIKFDMVHCRSYIAADTGLALKRKFGIKFFFDMRGFWADEKKDGGSWNQDLFIFRKVYQYYKQKEASYLKEADHIISLTIAGKKELERWPVYHSKVPISVIPCCADMDHFTLTSLKQKQTGRNRLKISEDQLVISYLGSVGTWYMLNEMLEFFSFVKKKYERSVFLVVTHSDEKLIREKASRYSLVESDIVITEATRAEVPVFIKASDLNISFIKPVFSKISSSPTKLGEVLSMGIPVICNAGIGDVADVIAKTDSGYVLRDFTPADFINAVEVIPSLLEKDPLSIREKASEIYNLQNGVVLYKNAYDRVFK